MGSFARQLHDFRLTTAEIIYRPPDHPDVLQSYIWQDLDLMPELPVLNRFLTFWQKNIEGRLFSVTVASVDLIKPAEIKFCQSEIRLH